MPWRKKNVGVHGRMPALLEADPGKPRTNGTRVAGAGTCVSDPE